MARFGPQLHRDRYVAMGRYAVREERFEDFYDDLDDGDREDLPIRVRYERYDDIDHSIIEADADGDDFYEIAIRVEGIQLPFNIEPTIV